MPILEMLYSKLLPKEAIEPMVQWVKFVREWLVSLTKESQFLWIERTQTTNIEHFYKVVQENDEQSLQLWYYFLFSGSFTLLIFWMI